MDGAEGFRALVFDFDGVIADTESQDLATWREVFAAHGAELPLEVWARGLGTADSGFDPLAYLESRTGRPLDRPRLAAERARRFREMTAQLPALPGVREWVAEAQRLGLGLAVASSASRDWVRGHLRRLGLEDAFGAVLCREDVRRTKPDPELYRRAVQALGVRPAEAVAVEDSPNGIAAARAAGLRCVAVPGEATRPLGTAGADRTLRSLAEVPLCAVLASLKER